MSLINVSLSVTAYLDNMRSSNPKLKVHDSNISLLGMPTDKIETKNISLAPNESMLLMSTLRSLSYTTSTSFSVTKSQATIRLSGSFGQRISRTYGDITTQWALTTNQELSTLTFTGTGTAPNFTTMNSGDMITISAPFSSLNQGDFQIVKVGSNFIQYINQIGAGELQTGLVQIYAQGPVQKGDTIDIQSSQFSSPNKGQFILTRVTDTFVEFSNTNGIPEGPITNVAALGISVYSNLFRWMYLATDQKVSVKLNDNTTNSDIVEPPVSGDLANNPGMMIKRGAVYQITVQNLSSTNVSGFVLLAE